MDWGTLFVQNTIAAVSVTLILGTLLAVFF